MKELSKAEQLVSKFKRELNKPKLNLIRRVYLKEKIELVEEFIILKLNRKDK